MACVIAGACGVWACASGPAGSSSGALGDPTVAHEDPARRPDGVWVEPSPAIPPAAPSAAAGGEGEGLVIALRTPVDRGQVLRLVHRFVDALIRNDEHGAEALCAPNPAAGVDAATRVRVLTRSHDYTKLAGQRVFRDENVRVRRGNEDADGGTHDAGLEERNSVSVRVTVDVSQAGGEVLFGTILGLELVEANGALLIKDLDLNADP
jgi:hypothetical protein